MNKRNSLLAGAKRAVVAWGGQIRKTYGDDHGKFAFRFTYRGDTFIGVSKQSPHQDQASFEQKVARQAAHLDVLLVEFFGEGPTLGSTYVFDPETVLEDGEESIGSSKKGIRTEWYELPLGQGVLLGDFVNKRGHPSEPSEAAEEPRPTGITDYC